MPFDFACPDWVERLEQGRPPMPDLPLDMVAADRAVGIYDNLRLPDVPGQPRLAEAGADWFRAMVRAAFGSAHPDTGERQVGEIFCLVPKKNSKTTNSAAFGLTALLVNTVPNAEMYIVGPTKEVADTCFSQAKGMIEADPVDEETGESYLQNRFWVRDATQEIQDRLTGAVLKIVSFDVRVLTGKIPLLVILDELHVLGSNAKAERVLAQLRGGMITRPDALLLIITTQSDEPPAGVFKKELEFARKVRDGKVKGSNLLPCLYEFPEALQSGDGKPWRDPKLWPMVLPNLGKSITLDRLVRLYRQALEKGADNEMVWASQHLNIQIGMGLHSDRWIGADLWPAAAAPATLDEILAQSDCVTLGIDGGGLDDLLGLGVIGRHRETRRWHAWARAWAHPEVLERRKEIAPRLQDFAAQGDLVICDDPTQDLRDVAAICARIHAEGLLPEKHGIGLDPFGVAALVDELAGLGLEGDLLTAIGQGTRLSPAVWGVERKLKDGSLVHADQDMLAWCVGNARTEQRGNAVLITKAVAGKAKIDPLIGIFNAAMLMARNPEAAGGASSPWDDPAYSLGG
ncbi:terminase large subunit [Phaeobacter gallaeciensis]|uniref:terminase large subunit n=1 Tax=Phaeobacter gallaeciensis TaxID=60890 RepID=UPI00237F7EAE|nr:terminase large subunit [Phaeobacter gallaeciensis]MDE4059762.1 terminase large subunit [Phaeobacter gallaeciensis]MDE4122601.1 terminase large subunit [Phaeobacter gallaeciensis]MDE4127250.1 terminase large subunit [Phaeobacter gallaeciensis]